MFDSRRFWYVVAVLVAVAVTWNSYEQRKEQERNKAEQAKARYERERQHLLTFATKYHARTGWVTADLALKANTFRLLSDDLFQAMHSDSAPVILVLGSLDDLGKTGKYTRARLDTMVGLAKVRVTVLCRPELLATVERPTGVLDTYAAAVLVDEVKKAEDGSFDASGICGDMTLIREDGLKFMMNQSDGRDPIGVPESQP